MHLVLAYGTAQCLCWLLLCSALLGLAWCDLGWCIAGQQLCALQNSTCWPSSDVERYLSPCPAVLREVGACTRAFPNAYIRLVAFDSVRQVQIAGFLVHRPSSAKEWCPPNQRSV